MIDPTSTAAAASEHRFPAAYSQGFAHVRILTVINPDDPGPLGGRDPVDITIEREDPFESAPTIPLDELLRTD
jgi:hypothetical protein